MTLKETVDKSIRHWRRMIRWAKTQNPDTKPNHRDLWLGLEVTWNRYSCDICQYYLKHPGEPCFLNPQCVTKLRACHPTWFGINNSKTWSEWIIKAKVFLAVIIKYRKEMKNGGMP